MHKKGIYERFLKRLIDFLLSLFALIILLPILLIIALLVRIKLGSPVIFKQYRPGLNESIFSLYKFRSMSNQRDSDGNMLPDELRITRFGELIRSTSIDELPSLLNILKGDMSFVGPRPLLIEDMHFMSVKNRSRHNVKPGLTGLAQINGRNNIDWDYKLELDVHYVQNITFVSDILILIKTVLYVIKRKDIKTDGYSTSENYGEYLLREGKITQSAYDKIKKQPN